MFVVWVWLTNKLGNILDYSEQIVLLCPASFHKKWNWELFDKIWDAWVEKVHFSSDSEVWGNFVTWLVIEFKLLMNSIVMELNKLLTLLYVLKDFYFTQDEKNKGFGL